MHDVTSKTEYTPKELRLLAGYTQKEVAEKLEISESTYRKIELSSEHFGKTQINVMKRMCKLYGIRVNQINFFY